MERVFPLFPIKTIYAGTGINLGRPIYGHTPQKLPFFQNAIYCFIALAVSNSLNIIAHSFSIIPVIYPPVKVIL